MVPIAVKFTTKRNSRRPYLRLSVKSKDGSAFPLTGALSVRFLMYSEGSNVAKVDADAVLEDIPGGLLRYEWAATDLDTAGEFFAEFDVSFPNGEKMTLPLTGVIRVTVYEDLNNA